MGNCKGHVAEHFIAQMNLRILASVNFIVLPVDNKSVTLENPQFRKWLLLRDFSIIDAVTVLLHITAIAAN